MIIKFDGIPLRIDVTIGDKTEGSNRKRGTLVCMGFTLAWLAKPRHKVCTHMSCIHLYHHYRTDTLMHVHSRDFFSAIEKDAKEQKSRNTVIRG